MTMHVRDFDYDLPEDRIAQEPAGLRGGSRLLVVGPGGDAAAVPALTDAAFAEIGP